MILGSSIFQPMLLSKNGIYLLLIVKFNSKDQICKEFGIDSSKYTLYRVDAYEEPAFPIRRDKQEITKCYVNSGDLLILKGESDLTPDEKLSLNIHMTTTGLPEDSQYIDRIEISKEYTIRDLKDIVLSMPQFDFAKNLVRKFNLINLNL